MNYLLIKVNGRLCNSAKQMWKQDWTTVRSKMTEEYQDRNYSTLFNFSFFNSTDNSSMIGDYIFEPNFSVIVTYLFLFTIAAVGNLTVFISLFRSRHRRSRISLMIRHLAIADLIVTFVMIPIEVSKINEIFVHGNWFFHNNLVLEIKWFPNF